jgi:hypothetical protein
MLLFHFRILFSIQEEGFNYFFGQVDVLGIVHKKNEPNLARGLTFS